MRTFCCYHNKQTGGGGIGFESCYNKYKVKQVKKLIKLYG